MDGATAIKKLREMGSAPTCSRCRTKMRPRQTAYVGSGVYPSRIRGKTTVLCSKCGIKSKDPSLTPVEVPSYRQR